MSSSPTLPLPDSPTTGSGPTAPPGPPVPAPLSGLPAWRFGPYETLARLGHGGLGDVYRVRDDSGPGRVVALKLLRSGPHAGPGEVRSFRKEIEAARRLRHAHILPILEAGAIG